MVYLTAIHLGGGSSHEHVTDVRWLDSSDGKSNVCSTGQMIELIEVKKLAVQVGGAEGPADVGVATESNGKKYLRTHHDGSWDNNLLALPKF